MANDDDPKNATDGAAEEESKTDEQQAEQAKHCGTRTAHKRTVRFRHPAFTDSFAVANLARNDKYR